jgi:hypothetical protein
MNNEDPFRVSSMVLMVACLLCGITAGSYFVPRFSRPSSTVYPLSVTDDSRHLDLSEFQKDERKDAVQSFQRVVESEPPLFPVSQSKVIASEPIEDSTSHKSGQRNVNQDNLSPSHADYPSSVSAERKVSHSSSLSDSLPHIYAPVTVHPVTVNIDNTGVIHEISRIHDRLDALTTETRRTVQSPSTIDETATMPPTPPVKPRQLARRFEYIVHDDHATELVIQSPPEPIHVDESPLKVNSTPPPKRVVTRLPTAPAPSTHRKPVADIQFFKPDKPLAATPEPKQPEPFPNPIPEPQLEIIPQQEIPDISIDDPPAVELPSVEPEVLPELDFSAELIPVPEPSTGIYMTPQDDIPVLLVFDEQEIERTAVCGPVNRVHHLELPKEEANHVVRESHESELHGQSWTEQIEGSSVALGDNPPTATTFKLEIDATLISTLDTAKRTTDAPFMNGRKQQDATLTTRIPNTPSDDLQLISHTTPSPVRPPTPSNCRHCDAAHRVNSPTYRIQAVTPLRTMQRIKSLFR